MTAVGISNAIIGFAIVIVVHGMLIPGNRQSDRPPRQYGPHAHIAQYGPNGHIASSLTSLTGIDTFTDSVVKPDPKSEMLDFANNNESWSACSVKLPPQSEAPMMVPTSCQRAETKYTDRTVVNTYENEMASNGGDLGGGLRGYEDVSPMGQPL